MNKKELDESAIREIGELLLATHGRTANISDLSRAFGISRPTLMKWIADDVKLWDLTRLVPDGEIIKPQEICARDSTFFWHAAEYRRRVLDIRRRAASGELGAALQGAELERARKESAGNGK